MLAKVGSTPMVWVWISGGWQMSDKSGNLRDLISLWTLRGRLKRWGDWPVTCAGLASPSGCFQPLVLGQRVDANKAPWSTCSELDTSHFPDAGPASVALRWQGSLLSLPCGLEPILQTQAAGLFVSETGLGSERLIFWDGLKRDSVHQVPRGTEIS